MSGDGIDKKRAPGYQLRLRMMPEPLAEECDSRGRWRTVWPEFRLIPEVNGAANEELKSFIAEIPAKLCSLVRPFSTHQWMLLLLLSKSDKALELAMTNPVLAYALANNHEFRSTSCRVAEQLALFHSGQKQRQICQWLGFPGTQAMVNLFKRIDPGSISPSLLRRLRISIQDEPIETMKLLTHRGRISAGIIDLVAEQRVRHMITPRLLDEIEANESQLCISAADDLFHVISSPVNAVGEKMPRYQVSSLAKLRKIVEDVDRRCLEYRREIAERERIRSLEMARVEAERQRFLREQRQRRGARIRKAKKPEWPPPPLPGTPDIVPITSYKMLCQESELQHHCIDTYLEYITDDRAMLYAYRLLRPERATFTIARRIGNTWGLGEIKGRSNKVVSEDARRYVERWLNYYQKPVTAADLPAVMA